MSAKKLFTLLKKKNHNLVLAESCTAGLTASIVSSQPGISKNFAGSFVCYQTDSKISWLKIPKAVITKHSVVSKQVAQAMAIQSLKLTKHATFSASVTGYLGPSAPKNNLGLVYMSTAKRVGSKIILLKTKKSFLLPTQKTSVLLRSKRQKLASQELIQFLIDSI